MLKIARKKKEGIRKAKTVKSKEIAQNKAIKLLFT